MCPQISFTYLDFLFSNSDIDRELQNVKTQTHENTQTGKRITMNQNWKNFLYIHQLSTETEIFEVHTRNINGLRILVMEILSILMFRVFKHDKYVQIFVNTKYCLIYKFEKRILAHARLDRSLGFSLWCLRFSNSTCFQMTQNHQNLLDFSFAQIWSWNWTRQYIVWCSNLHSTFWNVCFNDSGQSRQIDVLKQQVTGVICLILFLAKEIICVCFLRFVGSIAELNNSITAIQWHVQSRSFDFLLDVNFTTIFNHTVLQREIRLLQDSLKRVLVVAKVLIISVEGGHESFSCTKKKTFVGCQTRVEARLNWEWKLKPKMKKIAQGLWNLSSLEQFPVIWPIFSNSQS